MYRNEITGTWEMSVQLTLDLGKVAKKRIRYDVPNYLNFYSLYQYDRNKFRESLRAWLKTDEGK